MQPPRIVFFGTPEFATIVLDELASTGYTPVLVVTAPDKPQGRKLLLTPSPVKKWAIAHNIPVITPGTLKDDAILATLQNTEGDLFIVAAYGKLIPKTVLDLPQHGTLNVHPSLLPKFRGSSPIESAILSDEIETGVSIMEVDEEMDHGPIVAQKKAPLSPLPSGSLLTKTLAKEGGKVLAEIIPAWIKTRKAIPQEDSKATYTKKITKEDGLIDLSGDALRNYKKIRAFDEWPGAYFFTERNGKQIRVRVTDAELSGETLVITRVVPEGKKEMLYADFLRGSQ